MILWTQHIFLISCSIQESDKGEEVQCWDQAAERLEVEEFGTECSLVCWAEDAEGEVQQVHVCGDCVESIRLYAVFC